MSRVGRGGSSLASIAQAFRGEGIGRGRRLLLGSGCLGLAALLWLPTVHLLFRPDLADYRAGESVAPRARALAERHLRSWSDPGLRAEELRRLRGSNAEWDFMARTFLVLALSNLALREPAAAPRYLEVADQIIDETLRIEKQEGPLYFLMSYARAGPFRQQPPRSIFIDGEIALMLAARRLAAEKPAYRPLLTERVQLMAPRMAAAPVHCLESYPDECWTFCNAIGLAAIRIADRLDGTDHGSLFKSWVSTARRRLIDRGSGLLISSFHLDGSRRDGPEGSSIWMALHALQIIDPVFAREQYQLARAELRRTFLGFGYAREWPASAPGELDIDSGVVLPLLEASPAASGLALLGAASFDDADYLRELLAALEFAAFPVARAGTLRFAASNPVGDAVLLYSLVEGPLWKRVGASP